MRLLAHGDCYQGLKEGLTISDSDEVRFSRWLSRIRRDEISFLFAVSL